MRFINKYKLEILIALIFTALYFLLRIYNILHLPIFTDEAIYVRWSQIAKQDANWRFISLTDGKQPMFVWAAMIFMKFIKDPLLASRFVSVACGFATMIGLFFLGRELFRNRWIGILSAGLYLVYPFALVYDRMALYESMVSMFTVWSLYVSILLVRKLTLGISMVLALIIGGSALTKSSGFASALFLPFTLLLFDFKQKQWKKNLLKWVWFACIASVLAYLYYSVLRLSPFFHIIAEKNTVFVYPLNEWIKHPFTFFYGNLVIGQWNWLYTYVSWGWLILVVVSFFINKKFLREKLILLVWFIAPFVMLALIGKTLYPRYILFMTISLLLLVAFAFYYAWTKIKTKLLYIVLALLFLAQPAWADYKILTDFSHAPLPKSDLDQYINDWPSGGGVNEAVNYFRLQAQNQKIYIATEGTFGLMPFGLEIYLVSNPNVTIKGFWPVTDTMLTQLVQASKKMPTYVLFYQPCPSCTSAGQAPTSWPLTKVLEVKKGNGDKSLSVYKVK